VIDPGFFQLVYLFLFGIDQLQPVIIREKYRTRVWIKGEQNALATHIFRHRYQPVQNNLMPTMNAIESSDCKYRGLYVLKAVYIAVYFQKECGCSRRFAEVLQCKKGQFEQAFYT
jgi:hypothetical protein